MLTPRTYSLTRFVTIGAALALVVGASSACGKKTPRNPVTLAGTSAFGPGGIGGSGSGSGDAWGPGGAPGSTGFGAGFDTSLMNGQGGSGSSFGDGAGGMMNNANTSNIADATMIADLEMVHFEFDSDQLTPEWLDVLDRNAGWLTQNLGVNVQVEGHTDERGTEEYNVALGQRRADVVREYLVGKGVDANRISTISYGKMRPLTFEYSEDGHSLNRRAMFLVYSPEAGTMTASSF